MDCVFEVEVHRVAHNMGHMLAAAPGQDSREASHTVCTVVAMVAVQPVLLVAQAGKV